MAHAVLAWFPNSGYANLFAVVVLCALLADEVIPRLMGGKARPSESGLDRGSFLVIYVASTLGLAAGLYFRYYGIGVVPFWAQAFALFLVIIGAVLRGWAIVLLGRYFSRTVTIEEGHQLITSGPFRLIRHPAYTGMLIVDTAIILGLGTWVGAAVMFAVLLGAVLYRIQVEEKALLEKFGDQYRAYMQVTGRLFPHDDN